MVDSPKPDAEDYDPASNPHKIYRGWRRLWFATRHSSQGFLYAFREESAFRQELVLSLLLGPWAFILDFSMIERILLLGSLVILLMVELLNSGIEAAVDRISLNHHSLSKRAKDYGSAAVLLAIVQCGGIWISLVYNSLR